MKQKSQFPGQLYKRVRITLYDLEQPLMNLTILFNIKILRRFKRVQRQSK